MEFKATKELTNEQWNKVWNLYENSFPETERRKLEDHKRASDNSFYHPLSVWDDNQLIGIVFYWQWSNYRYVEHLAVSPELHGYGYGSRIMKKIINSNHTVILEIDPLINELYVRRLQFYEQAGFTLTPYRFFHLPYRLNGKTQELLILSYPKMITKEQHKDFLNFTNNHIRKYCERASS